jgi:hypothetical protein
VLVSIASGVSCAVSITIPASYAFGTYTITVEDASRFVYTVQFTVIPAPPPASTVVISAGTTGFDVVSEIQVRLRESQSTTVQQQSMLYLRHVRRTLDEVGRRTWSIFDTAVCDIISGQTQYVMPHRPFELRTLNINDGNGNIFSIDSITMEEADDKFGLWRNGTQSSGPLYQGIPRFYVDEGTNVFWLLPTPNYNVQDGIIVNGYFGVDKWYTMDLPLPLPEGFDEVVMYGTAMRRCEEMKPQDVLYAQMLPDYSAKYEDLLCRHYREALGKTASRRNFIPSLGKRTGWGGGWSWLGW